MSSVEPHGVSQPGSSHATEDDIEDALVESLAGHGLGTLPPRFYVIIPCLPSPDHRIDMSVLPQACVANVDRFFLRNHLRPPLMNVVATQAMLEDIEAITTARSELGAYSSISTLLTTLSKELYGELSWPSLRRYLLMEGIQISFRSR